ncbi:MAG: peptidoglycan-binding protein, partial [Rhodoglobus sp.]|nr:peptidoglycan-binding protein [Rhodoglobus sp.]
MKRAFAVIAAFVLGSGVVVGAAFAYYLLPSPDGDLAPSPYEKTYPVTLVDFADQRTLPLAPTFAEGAELRAAAAGVVTSNDCIPGQAFVSGKVAFSVDGSPVVALSADVPFYRDLRWGDTGSDVDSLRRALAALGYSVAASGEFSSDVAEALSKIQDSEGLAFDDGGFHLTDFLWVPAGAAVVASCEAKIGQSYMSGSVFATTASTLTALSLAGS